MVVFWKDVKRVHVGLFAVEEDDDGTGAESWSAGVCVGCGCCDPFVVVVDVGSRTASALAVNLALWMELNELS